MATSLAEGEEPSHAGLAPFPALHSSATPTLIRGTLARKGRTRTPDGGPPRARSLRACRASPWSARRTGDVALPERWRHPQCVRGLPGVARSPLAEERRRNSRAVGRLLGGGAARRPLLWTGRARRAGCPPS